MMGAMTVEKLVSIDELMEQKRIELEDCLKRRFPDRDIKIVRTITRERLFYVVDSSNGQVTTLIVDSDGYLRVRYPTGITSDALDSDGLIHHSHLHA